MKVLSMLQPWASLVVMGAKQYETRRWKTGWRGPLLIHASSKKFGIREGRELERAEYFRDFVPDLDALPYGCLIGRVELVAVYPTEWVVHHPDIKPIGNWNQEFAFDDFSEGRWAWDFRDPQFLPTCIPVKGRLGLWEYHDVLD